MSFLVILVVVLGLIATIQLARVYDLTRGISDKREEDISEADIKFNGNGMLIFLIALMAFFVWLVFFSKDLYYPEAASVHGKEIDKLLNFNWWIVIPVFVLMNILLYGFTWKYQYRKDRKAFWYPHNNKLELIWTVVPAIVLAVIIIWGITVWSDTMMGETKEDAIHIELYSKQFDWTIRYAGEDQQLGPSNFNFISGANAMGIITNGTRDAMLEEVNGEIDQLQEVLDNDKNNIAIISAEDREEKEDKLGRLQRKKLRILAFMKDMNKNEGGKYDTGKDDYLVAGEFYIPVDREIFFHINARDVIHSAYMPHFRMQMNAVPGQETTFRMTPTITTEDMRKKTGDPDFDYVLMCNKICGASHYNMQRTVKVVSQETYDAWLKYEDIQNKTPRKTFAQALGMEDDQPLLGELSTNEQNFE
ncbi:MAG: cytochrome c oxidase subunit II [Bacteroidota bacterium]